jgi:Chagasin family peptidase inhibitor I42
MDELRIRKGETYELALPGLGSAGYQWIAQPCDPPIVSVEEILHKEEESLRAVRGHGTGSLEQRFRLTATTPGQAVVRFVQVRRFAPLNPSHASHEIAVTVTNTE